METLSKRRRSWNMSRIRGADTQPEKSVRSLLHRMGCRFRLHRRDLPGTPDIVLPKHRTVVFVHGCFWHRHAACKYAYTPKSRIAFWQKKFKENCERDRRHNRQLRRRGWHVVTVWECDVQRLDRLQRRLERQMSVT